MRFCDPIYPITDIELSGLSHTEQVQILVGAGVKLIQLREKQMPTDAFAKDAQSAIDVARSAGVKILINDRVDIALAIHADGVHLGQTDLTPKHARNLLGNDAIIGYSTHNAAQAVEAMNEPVDYVAIGPIFPTTTKNNPYQVVGLETLSEIRRITDGFPLVAIGGIDDSNIESVAASGVDAAALIASILGSNDPIESAVRTLRAKWTIKNV